jgi:hypothetical protein
MAIWQWRWRSALWIWLDMSPALGSGHGGGGGGGSSGGGLSSGDGRLNSTSRGHASLPTWVGSTSYRHTKRPGVACAAALGGGGAGPGRAASECGRARTILNLDVNARLFFDATDLSR